MLRRTLNSVVGGPLAIWTKGSTSTGVNHILTQPLESVDLVSGRFALEITSSTGDLKAKVIVRTSSDGVSWDAWVDLEASPTWQSNDGTTEPNTWITLATPLGTVKTYIQFGVHARNISGATYDSANATLRVEFKKC